MRCSLLTTTQIILDEQQTFVNFLCALCRDGQLFFYEIFACVRKHVVAINQADQVLLFEIILLAMLIEMMCDVIRLQVQGKD